MAHAMLLSKMEGLLSRCLSPKFQAIHNYSHIMNTYVFHKYIKYRLTVTDHHVQVITRGVNNGGFPVQAARLKLESVDYNSCFLHSFFLT